ncbi:MAG: hypothetical protein II695_00005 [Oscillospiraceae bacterium]|nr:hypothetical protein [Oscillospiraceae bacterium]
MYRTTKLHQLKSYPTYQFYARADSRKHTIDEVFRICVLHTLKWLRNRLSNFGEMPECICTPEPECFAEFDADRLASFSITEGAQIDVIYVEKSGIWSLKITEPDMGSNFGTETERQPVSGRTFITEISFCRQEEYVETGIRTICAEPSDTQADCEVFRLALVKALVRDANIRLMQSGYIIDGKPVSINSKAELDRFLTVFGDRARSMPLILFADTATVQAAPAVPANADLPLLSDAYISGLAPKKNEINLTISADVDLKKPFMQKGGTKKKRAAATVKPTAAPVKTKLPAPDAVSVAARLVGFAMVATLDEGYFAQLQNKLHISPAYGEVIIISHQQVAERISYDSYRNDMAAFPDTLVNEMIQRHKRCSYSFGEVRFHSDAKLRDLQNKRHQTASLADKCNIYKQENDELKKRIKELTEQQRDMELSAEQLRSLNKRTAELERALEDKTAEADALERDAAEKADAYRRSAELMQFYKDYTDLAERFPTDKNDVCDWAEKTFGGHLVITSRARNEMKKYNRALDISALCNGIVYLDAYVRYRRGELSAEALSLYSERRHWEAAGCGKEALKLHRDAYSVSVDGHTYILDQHIKRGIRSEELIRIYFCWDDADRTVVIGSMPEHLPTVKNST